MGNQAYKLKHKAQGLCVDCSHPAISSGVRCIIHTWNHLDQSRKAYQENIEFERERSRKKAERYKAEGRCPGCGAPLDEDADKGHIRCVNCRGEVYRDTFK